MGCWIRRGLAGVRCWWCAASPGSGRRRCWIMRPAGRTLTGLGDADARALLASAVGGRLDAEVRDRIVAETGGNPLALLQLPRGLRPAELGGGFWLPDPRPLASRIETSFLRQFRS